MAITRRSCPPANKATALLISTCCFIIWVKISLLTPTSLERPCDPPRERDLLPGDPVGDGAGLVLALGCKFRLTDPSRATAVAASCIGGGGAAAPSAMIAISRWKSLTRSLFINTDLLFYMVFCFFAYFIGSRCWGYDQHPSLQRSLSMSQNGYGYHIIDIHARIYA